MTLSWQNCPYMGVAAFCGPIGLPGGHGVLYHNNRDGTFTDVTRRAGLGELKPSHAFTAVFDDFNQDGKVDLFVANDSDPNFLFLNQGDGTFKESGVERGVAFNGDGRAQSNMGVAVGDIDNQGRLHILTATFLDDYFPLFKQDKSGFYDDASTSAGLTMLTNLYLGWACGFADFDNDGKRDLWLANGHVYPRVPQYFQPFAVLRNNGSAFSAAFRFPVDPNNSYRGGCAGDFDNDGRMDVAVLPVDGQPLLLENKTSTANSWVGVHLRGTHSNRDAIGARVRLLSCGKVDRVTVTWPSGTVQVVSVPAVNRYTTIEEPR